MGILYYAVCGMEGLTIYIENIYTCVGVLERYIVGDDAISLRQKGFRRPVEGGGKNGNPHYAALRAYFYFSPGKPSPKKTLILPPSYLLKSFFRWIKF